MIMSRGFPLSTTEKIPSKKTPAPPPELCSSPVFSGVYGRPTPKRTSVIWTSTSPTSPSSTPLGLLQPLSRIKSWSVFLKLPTSISPRPDDFVMLLPRQISPRGPSPGQLLVWRSLRPMLFPASLRPNYAPPYMVHTFGRLPSTSSHSQTQTVFPSNSFSTVGFGRTCPLSLSSLFPLKRESWM